jgi:hypothetical protein
MAFHPSLKPLIFTKPIIPGKEFKTISRASFIGFDQDLSWPRVSGKGE